MTRLRSKTVFFLKNMKEIMTVGQVNHLHLSNLLTFTGQAAFLIPGKWGDSKSFGKQFCQIQNLMDLCVISTVRFVCSTIFMVCKRFLYSGQERGGLTEVPYSLFLEGFSSFAAEGRKLLGTGGLGLPLG